MALQETKKAILLLITVFLLKETIVGKKILNNDFVVTIAELEAV